MYNRMPISHETVSQVSLDHRLQLSVYLGLLNTLYNLSLSVARPKTHGSGMIEEAALLSTGELLQVRGEILR
jgi:hypothetical protein